MGAITFLGLPASVKEAVRRKLSISGLAIANAAREECPVLTGYMRSTIWHKTQQERTTIGVAAWYASFVEYGTAHQAAQPFLRPALAKANLPMIWRGEAGEFVPDAPPVLRSEFKGRSVHARRGREELKGDERVEVTEGMRVKKLLWVRRKGRLEKQRSAAYRSLKRLGVPIFKKRRR